MRRAALKASASRWKLSAWKVMASSLFVVACAVSCAAQSRVTQSTPAPQPPTQTPTSAPTTSPARGQADEDFDLNITERRITEPEFFASTEIAAGDESARGLSLRVGVAVGAERIDVLLRNVQGHVRFRASLDALRRVLDARRAATTNEQSNIVP
jgi:hypothetical protein